MMAGTDTRFKKGDPRASVAGRRGGEVLAARRRRENGPYDGTPLDVMDAAVLTGPTWAPWRVFLKATFGLPMDDAEVEVYRAQTDRETPPEGPVTEGWMAVGRRGGKSRIASLVAFYCAIRFDASILAPGETAVIPVIGADRRQAKQGLHYVKGLCDLEEFRPYVHRILRDKIELNNRVNIEIATGSFRTVRGFTCPAVVCDEIAFWQNDDRSANPDHEILAALRPAMAAVPNGLLLGLSSPYAARGELYDAVDRYFGKDDPDVLVWNASTLAMRPTLSTRVVEKAFERDPVEAASEYGSDGRVQFRQDLQPFLSPAVVWAVTVADRRELRPQPNVRYVAFADPAGGSTDSFTLAIAHGERGKAVLDCVREIRPPFSPDSVVAEFAAVLRSYGLNRVEGDRYAAEWVVERFRRHGILYTHSTRTKSEIYLEAVAPINAGTVELLDLPALRTQLTSLQRSTGRSGRDTVDHPRGGRDDLANSVCGALIAAGPALGLKIARFG